MGLLVHCSPNPSSVNSTQAHFFAISSVNLQCCVPILGNVFPRLGRGFPTLSRHFPRLGRGFPRLRNDFRLLIEVFPSKRNIFSSKGNHGRTLVCGERG